MGIKCPQCQTDNPSDSKFCKECATSLLSAEEISASQTKTLTPVKELTRGTTFADRYEIIEQLGRGGMGKVYRVYDTKIEDEVAIKILKPDIATDKKTIERFRNELKFARKISHRNVCKMYDLNEEGDTRFITMEYVPGEDLKSFIRRSGQLGVGKSLSIAKQICEGLAEAHRLGVIHRDLKPGNIMVDREGNARIMDFGISRSIQAKGITDTGVMVGTPEYMSPEQVEGKDIDLRSDIYSLGVILYEMMTGKVPFEGDTPFNVALKHRQETPKAPRDINAQIPDVISKIVMRCLEKDRETRYQSVEDLLDDIKKEKIRETGEREKGKWAKLLATPIRFRKTEKPLNIKKKLIKSSIIVAAALVIFFVVISIVGSINDANYKARLAMIKVEQNNYFNNLYPLEKDWLPEEWGMRDCNACIPYRELFHPGQGKEYEDQINENPPWRELREVYRDFGYSNYQELKDFVEKYGKVYKFNEFYDAVKCKRINPLFVQGREEDYFEWYILTKYTEMNLLKARIDFLDGNYDEGVKKLLHNMAFSLDLFFSFHSSYSEAIFIKTCRELITLLLSREVILNPSSIEDLEKLLYAAQEKFDFEMIYYIAYLDLGDFTDDERRLAELMNDVKEDYYYRFIHDSPYKFLFDRTKEESTRKDSREETFNGLKYFLFDKLYFWKDGFSIYRNIYKKAESYQEMFDGLKYIRNERDKVIFIRDHLWRTSSSWYGSYFISFYTGFDINIMRTFGKLALIVLTQKKHGFNSKEFLELKGTDTFINEMTGKRFEVVKEGSENFISLTEKFKLNLKNINYERDHKKILGSFRNFGRYSSWIYSLY